MIKEMRICVYFRIASEICIIFKFLCTKHLTIIFMPTNAYREGCFCCCFRFFFLFEMMLPMTDATE